MLNITLLPLPLTGACVPTPQVSKLNSKPGSSVGGIVSEMGWTALFTRGLPLRVVMIGTLTGAQWGIYDAYKVYVGL